MPSPQVPEIHRRRRVAESFGGDAERYDRARPAYSDALVRRIIAVSPGRNVPGVGCGTGIEARQFRAAAVLRPGGLIALFHHV
jgi:ubiquinone/menaquinone biosynthesis C-methylase UbiE